MIGVEAMKRFSIILPVFNIEEYVERAVLSVLEASAKLGSDNCEILLVDDGSTDRSGDICNQLQVKYPQMVKVLHKENGGLASARNTGIHASHAEYVVFIDGDDWIESNMLEQLNQVISRDHPDAVKYGYSRVENRKKVFFQVPCLAEGFYGEPDMMTQVYPELLGNGRLFDYDSVFLSSACMTAYRLGVIRKYQISFQSERVILNEDILFNMEFFLRAKSLYVIHNPFYNYDCRDGSLTQRYKPKMYERKLNLFSYYEKIAKKENIFANKLIQSRYYQFIIQHIYDCAVMEVQWNKDKKTRNIELKKILKDHRFHMASHNISDLQCGLKARLILLVMRLHSPIVFYELYQLTHMERK